MESDTIIVTGACGQIGSELVTALAEKGYTVIATDLRNASTFESTENVVFEQLDVLDKTALQAVVEKYKPTQIYHLAALLSASAEKNPTVAWEVNMKGLLYILDISVANKISKVFYPSTIAVFGGTTPKDNTPQKTVTEPETVYGISKLAGENWCAYYYKQKGLDVRSLRYPGLISYKTKAGGGTTDYAVDIFFEAIKNKKYTCFLKSETMLPMMYMPDAIEGTIALMEAPSEKIKIRNGYNFAAFSFTPNELADNIRKFIPEFEIEYDADFRQKIAESWPKTIDDSNAKSDWGWTPKYSLETMTKDMIINIEKKEAISNHF
jgi:nucleoside-diphosphate-sugar epimerase